jgi:hypothetical protein
MPEATVITKRFIKKHRSASIVNKLSYNDSKPVDAEPIELPEIIDYKPVNEIETAPAHKSKAI